jgi:hypothetical protein
LNADEQEDILRARLTASQRLHLAEHLRGLEMP